jgi:O-antigen ligase
MRKWIVAERWRNTAVPALLLALAALLPFGVASELPLLLLALAGTVEALRRRIGFDAPAVRLAALFFLVYWLPELGSAIDSVMPRKSWTEVAADLRFLPMLWLVADTRLEPRAWRRFELGLAALLGFWLLDALLQAATGWSLGGADRGDRLSGIFGDEQLKLGGVVAALSPFLLLPAARRAGLRGLLLAFLPLLVVVLLAGARAAWVTLALALAQVLWQQWGARRGTALLALLLGAGVLAGALANSSSPRFAERVERTAAALSGDPAALDHALAGRLPIWRTALAMAAAHPVNGVGVRGFRHAYARYAAPDDPWVDPRSGVGALHAHHWLLEVASETGLFGMLCWLLGIAAAWRAWRLTTAAPRARAAPAAIALVATLFPLNTHYAVYSSFWSLLLFLLLASAIAASRAQDQSPP